MQGTAVDWDTSDKESRAMAFSLNAGPSTTKHCLKNVLGGVKDSASRQSKNPKSMYTKWLFAVTSKYPTAGGVQQLQMELDDLQAVPFSKAAWCCKRVWAERGQQTLLLSRPKRR